MELIRFIHFFWSIYVKIQTLDSKEQCKNLLLLLWPKNKLYSLVCGLKFGHITILWSKFPMQYLKRTLLWLSSFNLWLIVFMIFLSIFRKQTFHRLIKQENTFIFNDKIISTFSEAINHFLLYITHYTILDQVLFLTIYNIFII